MKKINLFIVGMLIILVLGLSACGDGDSATSDVDESSTSEDPTTSESSSSDDGEEGVVNIGFSGPLSGPAAFFGEATMSGLEMAADEINEEGFEVDGKTYKINLVGLDDQYMPNEAASNAKRLVQEHDTPLIFTPHSGGIYAMQVFNEQEEFIIGGYSTEPGITEAQNSLTVRLPPNYLSYIVEFADYSMDRFGNKLAVIPPVSEYGQNWAASLSPYWEEQGGEVVHESSVDYSKDTDFFTILTNALDSDPDVILIGGPSEPTANLLKQARELGFEGGFIVMEQAKLNEMEKVVGSYELLEGAVGVLPFLEGGYEGTDAFVAKYEDIFDKMPESDSALHYMTMYFFVEAMKDAGTVDDAEAIYNSIQAGLDNYPQDKKLFEIPAIDDEGGLEVDVRVGAIEDGKIVEVTK